MNSNLKNILKKVFIKLKILGFDIRKIISFKNYPKFKKQKKEWINQGGKITHSHMILSNYSGPAGNSKSHYFHQDLLVAKYIYKHKPSRHIDVGSRFDGFVAHVASYREIEVLDIRPITESEHSNIKFLKADLMRPQEIGYTDSLSCLHAIEHFGLGRYGDPIDVDGHNKGIKNLVSLLKNKGRMYISFPIGKKNEVHFNAHRVFHPEYIFKHPSIKEFMTLLRFDYVDDRGDLHVDTSIDKINKNIRLGCGIYTFEKY